MASPKSMFSGTIQLGLINIPITIGKATSDMREQSLVQVCVGHKAGVSPQLIDRSERCPECDGPPQDKQLAVRVDEDEYRILDEQELTDIEEATKTSVLEITDAQPLDTLPLEFSLGTYYVRHDKKAKTAPKALGTLVATLTKSNKGLICKWGNSSRQKLCVISAERGVLILRVIPFLEAVRPASQAEREHFKVRVNPREVEKLNELLDEISNPDGFDYAAYHDEGLRLRQEAVERILNGEKPVKKAPPKVAEQLDELESIIDKSLAEARA